MENQTEEGQGARKEKKGRRYTKEANGESYDPGFCASTLYATDASADHRVCHTIDADILIVNGARDSLTWMSWKPCAKTVTTKSQRRSIENEMGVNNCVFFYLRVLW